MAKRAYILESDYNTYNAEVGNFTGTPPMLIFQYGGATFICLKRILSPTNAEIAIYRTTDGITFTSYIGATGNIDVMFAKDGNLVYAAFLAHGVDGGISVSVFDLDALSYIVTIASSLIATPANSSMGIAAYGGTITVFYYRVISSIPNLFYAVYNGVWSSETLVQTISSNGFRGVGVDPATGNIGIAYIPLSPFPTRFRSLSGGVLSSAADNSTQLSTDYGNCPMLFVAEEDKWMMPSAPSGGGNISLFTATPSVDPTTVAIETVATPPSGKTYRQPAVRRDGSNIAVFFEEYTGSSPGLILAAHRPVGGGSWTAPVTIFDRSSDSFSPEPSSRALDQSRAFIPLDSNLFAFAAGIPGSTLNEYLVSRLVGNVYFANAGSGPYCPAI